MMMMMIPLDIISIVDHDDDSDDCCPML
jgi:hypothetical protein